MIERVFQVLSREYFYIYYVDIKSGQFMDYFSRISDRRLLPGKGGKDFFENIKRIVNNLVMPDDQARVMAALAKDTLVRETEDEKTFAITYSRLLKGAPRYVRMKAMRIKEDPSHIVICLSDIDDQTRQEINYEKTRVENMVFSRIAHTLARDYFAIYYVDVKTDEYVEFSSTDQGNELKMRKHKNSFFETFRKNLMDRTYGAERYEAWNIWDKNAILEILTKEPSFSSTHRILLRGKTVYINVKAFLMDHDDGHHIVIGLRNIDAQIKQEKEFIQAVQMTVRDPLTGVKNKRAYAQMELGLNKQILKGTAGPFAIVICDINNLKLVNDIQGHAAGDNYIKEASREICNIFKHSPVFRVGGDEFAILLNGTDYENRFSLLEELASVNERNLHCDGVVIANGIAEFDPKKDGQVASLFSRADSAMYSNKKGLKKIKAGISCNKDCFPL